ncbi:DsbA family protein [Natrononativus amylolyticus]|uniref:DsbA family protein n=1 Tax=Natrononativus amylolyticus TaxID=2963434 RepID=UPI0020CECC53|nr:thioredoxin domain-containing protein [Natrononativus amylolyticus]
MGEHHSRRRILQVSSVGLLGGVAGCAGFVGETTDEPGSSEPRAEPTETASTGESDDGGTDAVSEPDDEPAEDRDSEESEPDEGEEPEEDDLDRYEIDEPAGALARLPIPDDPGSYQYPIAGTGDADVRVTLFGGWLCRHTQRFVEVGFDALLGEAVRDGEIDLEYHGVAYRDGGPLHGDDGRRAARAGLATWYAQPDAFWSFFEYHYVNMDPDHDGWASTDRLRQLGAEAGIENHEQFARTIDSGAFEEQLRETMTHVEEIPISVVPQVAIDGTSYSPNANPDDIGEAIEAALEGDG